MKKAQGLSLNTIIIAALVIMVLVILALVFTGQMGSFGSSSTNCQSKGGICTSEKDCPEGKMPAMFTAKCDEGEQCCIPSVI